MKKWLILTMAAAMAGAVWAEDAAKPTDAEREQRYLQRTGGRVLKPGSRTGYLAVVNGQDKVTTAELTPTIEKIKDLLRLNIEVVDGEAATMSTAKARREELKADVAVFIVDDPELPMSLIAYEERWGMVNVAKLEDAKGNKVRRFGRTKNEMVRVLAMTCGACESQFPSSVLNVGTRPQDLDMASADLPFDVMNRMVASLKKSGVTPAVYVTYRRACNEGWAPKPENEFQQAIWDEFHAVPTEGLKIEFDAGKGK